MNKDAAIHTRRLVLAALLAALTTVGSALRITLPLSIAGTTSFHLGNILCALSGILLGPWLGGLAAGMGSALYDIMNPAFVAECWITFLCKGAYGVMAGLVVGMGRKPWGQLRATAAAAAGAVTYGLLYLSKCYFYDGLLLGGISPQAAWITVLNRLPATIFNGAVAVIFAPVLALAIRKALEKGRISL